MNNVEYEKIFQVAEEYTLKEPIEVQTAKTAILPIHVMEEEWITNKKKQAEIDEKNRIEAEERRKRQQEEFTRSLDPSTMTLRERVFRDEFVLYVNEMLLKRKDSQMRFNVMIHLEKFLKRMNKQKKNVVPCIFTGQNKRMMNILEDEYEKFGYTLTFYGNPSVQIQRKDSLWSFFCGCYLDVIRE